MEIPLPTRFYEFEKDSVHLLLTISPEKKNVVLPLFIFKGNKKKAKIEFGLHGKGISGREYLCTYQGIVIRNDSTVIGKSKSPDLFLERVQNPVPRDAVSPLYGSDYVLPLTEPKKAKLSVHFEFEVKNKAGLTERYMLDQDLVKIEQKGVTLLNVFK